MTLQEALKLVEDDDTCVVTYINSVEEFNTLRDVIDSLGLPLREVAEYGQRDGANVFYYYPIDGYYGHFELEELQDHATVIMSEFISKKQKIMAQIKAFL